MIAIDQLVFILVSVSLHTDKLRSANGILCLVLVRNHFISLRFDGVIWVFGSRNGCTDTIHKLHRDINITLDFIPSHNLSP